MEYWSDPIRKDTPLFHLEARASIALKLLDHFGVIAGKDGGEDSAGRFKIITSIPKETVERCFALADAFVDEAEKRNAIRPALSLKELIVLEKDIEWPDPFRRRSTT